MREPKKHLGGYYWTAPDQEWLKREYLVLGKSIKTIATEIGSGQGTVRRWLRTARVSRVSTSGAPQKFGAGHSVCWIPPSKEWLAYRYITLGIPVRVIVHRIGADGSTVRRWLKELGVPQWPKEEIHMYHARAILGAKNPRWTGGQSAGYVLETALTELEAANVPLQCALCDKEGKLDIHHKDGDRTNNPLENLQYLCRKCHRNLHLQEKRDAQ